MGTLKLFSSQACAGRWAVSVKEISIILKRFSVYGHEENSDFRKRPQTSKLQTCEIKCKISSSFGEATLRKSWC